jgi:hypothetical protein
MCKNAELLPQSQVFQEQIVACEKEQRKEDTHELQQAQHETSFARERSELRTQSISLI